VDSLLRGADPGTDEKAFTTAAPVSGFGDAAYTFTLADAGANSNGVATTVTMVLDGSRLIDITAEAAALRGTPSMARK